LRLHRHDELSSSGVWLRTSAIFTSLSFAMRRQFNGAEFLHGVTADLPQTGCDLRFEWIAGKINV
jgi:hypothetical protein